MPENKTDLMTALIQEHVATYVDANQLELTEDQTRRAIDGVGFWLKDALDDAVSDAVSSAQD